MILLYELLKTFRRWRTYIGFIAIGVFIPIVQLGLKLQGGTIVRGVTRDIAQDFMMFGNLFNTYFVTQLILNSLYVHIPFLITLVAGDMLAGEATGGTFRLLLTRPPSRTYIFCTKLIVALSYTALLVVFLAVLSLGLGAYLFGTGDLLVPGKVLTIISAPEVPLRMALAFAFAVLSMWCVASLALLFSSFVENAIGPIVASMAVIVICLLISTMDIALFEAIRPYLFTSYLGVWKLPLQDPIPWDEVLRSGAALAISTAGFIAAAWGVFVRKDILS